MFCEPSSELSIPGQHSHCVPTEKQEESDRRTWLDIKVRAADTNFIRDVTNTSRPPASSQFLTDYLLGSNTFCWNQVCVGEPWPGGAWRTPTLLQIENVNFLPLSTPSRLHWLPWPGGKECKINLLADDGGMALLGRLNGNSWLTGENGDYEDPWIPRVTLQHCHDDPFNWDKGGSGFLIWTQYEDDYKTRYTQNSLSPRGFNWLLLFKSLQHDLLVYLININTISVESMSSIFVWSSVVIFCPTEVKLKVFVVVLVLMSSSSSWETLQTGPSMVQWLFTEPGGWRGERAGCLQ